MTQRQLILVNQSDMPGSLVVFQQYGTEVQSPELAWFAKYVYPNTQVSFSWNDTDYDFVWAGTGQIQSGVVFDASQVIPANAQTSNEITLSYDGTNHVFYFNNQMTGQPAGVFIINADSSLPVNAAAAGIGMAGRAAFAVNVQPNIRIQIVPAPTYWVTFGTVKQGEFFTITGGVTPIQVTFPVNVNSMTVTLNADLTWTVQPNIMAAAR